MKINCIPSLCLQLQVLIILASFSTNKVVESDIRCLRSIKESLEDPLHIFSTWNFNNNTEGFICRFTGVECWQHDKNKVLNIRLPKMDLRGQFPMGIRNCDSLTGLDLSSNYLSGPIPSNIAQLLGFIFVLKLSNNSSQVQSHLALPIVRISMF
ncbi:unnamed protein product [Lactuca virosa]|uniref:Leucine-rich repeat-containing N-terminal plant-type domain-containing protein n=1 Tax=Lactuca virosa TaxID=75947 RepID=A0AAU9MDE6_9ASTR|nr:unnamed protein product [Lactuca virosa]